MAVCYSELYSWPFTLHSAHSLPSTTAFGASEDSPQQVIWWTNFIGMTRGPKYNQFAECHAHYRQRLLLHEGLCSWFRKRNPKLRACLRQSRVSQYHNILPPKIDAFDRSCFVNMPSDGYFNDGVMETCEGDVGLPVGVCKTSHWQRSWSIGSRFQQTRARTASFQLGTNPQLVKRLASFLTTPPL